MRILVLVPLLALLAMATLAGCLGGDGDAATTSTPVADPVPYRARFPAPNLTAEPPALSTNTTVDEPTVRFLLTGDTGTGGETQYKVADAMAKVCAERGCDFMAILGDVIYESGVSSADDPQFEEKFELPYAVLDFPIYNVLGNHDNSMDPVTATLGFDAGIGHWYEAGTYMVDYHYRTDRMSEKWQLPDRYYTFRFGDAEFFALDSNTMMFNDVATGSTNPEAYQKALDQDAWFDEAVAASNATWKFTLAHHPYVSNGEHGDAGHYDDEDLGPLGQQSAPGISGEPVKRFFDDHVCPSGVDVHFSGHDHDLQWLKPVASCGATEFIVSGAGAKSRELEEDPAEDAWFGQGGVQGFFWVEIRGNDFHAVVIDEEGTVLYERTLTKDV